MKNTLLARLGFILLMPLAATAQQYGDFFYSSDGTAITITGYKGPGGAVTIPATINGLPVTSLGSYACQSNSSLTSVTILNGVISIGAYAFAYCTSMTNVTIPNSVTSIGGSSNILYVGSAFLACRLTSVTIPGSVTNIGSSTFQNCYRLESVFFKGNAPSHGSFVFDMDTPPFGYRYPTVYFLPGSTGWDADFMGVRTRLWNPLIQSSGLSPAGFGFDITGTTNIPIVVEACINLANADWVPLQSLNLTNGFYFSDPDWTNYPGRFYRIRSP
jgi:hypothetical protein